MKQGLSEILVSESVYDSVSRIPYKGYVVIKDGMITETGKGAVPARLRDSGIPMSDYGHGTICAGLGDTHTFFAGYVMDSLGVDLSEVKTLKELKGIIEDELSTKEGGSVLFGNHLSGALISDPETSGLLDELGEYKEVSIILFATGHGTCAMNKIAQRRFEFDPDHCYSEAMHKIMPCYLTDRDFIIPQFKKYMKLLNSRGVTSVKEMGFDDYYGFTDVLKEMEESGELTVRICFMSQPVGRSMDLEYGKRMREKFTSDFVKFSGFNQMTDGLILKKQGHLLEPYEGTDTICEKQIDYEGIEKDVLEADRQGFRFTLHSEGDGAFRRILDIYDKCQKEDGKLLNRHGITDLELTDPEDEQRMARLGVFGEIYAQVYLLDTWKGYVDGYRAVIGDRQKRYLNYRSLTDHGVCLCGATDLPLLIPSLPEAVFYGCANYGSDRGKRINPDNGITVEEMVYAWTYGSQYAMEQESILGTLETGKQADIVIFDGDLFHTPMEKILDVKVVRTLVKGKEVYQDL